MPEQTNAQKLQIKTGNMCLIVAAPEGYLATLADVPPETITASDAVPLGQQFDMVQVFARNAAELGANADAAIKAIKPGGLLWFCYPKKSGKIKTDITRDVGWEIVGRLGYEGVRQISIDETWSALRFRPTADIKRKPDSMFLKKSE